MFTLALFTLQISCAVEDDDGHDSEFDNASTQPMNEVFPSFALTFP